MPSRTRKNKTAFVPKMVFSVAVACVVPVCVSGCASTTGGADSADGGFLSERSVADVGFRVDGVADVAFDVGRDFGPIISLAMMAFDAEAGTDATSEH